MVISLCEAASYLDLAVSHRESRRDNQIVRLIMVARHISQGLLGPLPVIREMASARIPQSNQPAIFAALSLTSVLSS